MTTSQPPDQTKSTNHTQAEAINGFNAIAATIENLLGSPPVDNYATVSFAPFPLQLTGPRFGAIERKDEKNQPILQFSQELLTQYTKYLVSILWREAYLAHLPYVVRQVQQAADLGLYCYYRYALRTKKQRDQFLQIWQTISPPIEYTFYRYYPTTGFEYFDNLVDGHFLKMVKEWFEPFSQLIRPLSTERYTANLEHWMFNYHRKLSPIELKILRGLNECLTCSQIELAERLSLRQPTISQVIKRLAGKHLLRFVIFENYPVLGLQPISIKFTSRKMKVNTYLQELISRIRYALGIQVFDDHLVAYFLIPTERMSRFDQWVKQVSSILELPLPKQRLVSERMHARNFDLYDPKRGGWLLEVESILENFVKLIVEDWASQLPQNIFFKLAPSNQTNSIKIEQHDFIYMQRACDAYLVTQHMKFFESKELRQAGFKESEHMAYRRRVKYLEKNNVISPPLGIGLLNIGLNAVIYMYLESNIEETRRILAACQLFPDVAGIVFNDGTGVATLPVPSAFAVSLKTSLEALFTVYDIPADISIRPAWQAYGWSGPSTLNSVNYDFTKNKWIWTKDTLPTPRNF